MRKTKIIATLGPAVEDEKKMRALVKKGVDIARLNAAHGSIENHIDMMKRFVEISHEEGKITAVMLDIKGPEVRVMHSRIRFAREGDTITVGEGGDIEFNHPEVYDVLKPGNTILIHDGDIEMIVSNQKDSIFTAKVVRGGIIAPRMGANFPGLHIPIEYIQDRDVEFMKSLGDVDFIAASFVRCAGDILALKKKMKEIGIEARIISKIENQEGVDNIDEILEVSDGIMVARGDLGTEIPVENIPGIQKYLLKRARAYGKPGIIATQILESMIRNPHPTRAEVSDIANSILDGADALMLSGETAIGKYPIEAVDYLSRVAEKADMLVEKRGIEELEGTISECVGNAAVLLANEVKANAILILTRSGKTARLVSRHRIPMPMLAASYSDKTLRELSIYWGVEGFKVDKFELADQAVNVAMRKAEELGLVHKGDVLVIAGGEPSGIPGTTNFVWVQIVGDIVARGRGFGKNIVTGIAGRNRDDEIVILEELTEEKLLRNNKGVIVESTVYSPKVIRNLTKKGISIIAGTGKIDVDGMKITLDPLRGVIWM